MTSRPAMRTLTMCQYQALPALSAGGAWTLSELCPALYWAQSPFNPNALPRKNANEFDIGTALHLSILEPHLYSDRCVHISFDDYRQIAAREQRDAAYANGQTPLKPKEVAVVDAMRDAIMQRPEIAALFRSGSAEVTSQWTNDGVPCKARADYLLGDRILDLKTMACAHPDAAAMTAKKDGWYLRAAWYLDAFPHARHYLFVCVEKSPPYLIEVYELDERAIGWGQMVMRRSLRMFKYCRENNRWPGYDGQIPAKLSLPAYAEYALAEREQAGEFGE